MFTCVLPASGVERGVPPGRLHPVRAPHVQRSHSAGAGGGNRPDQHRPSNHSQNSVLHRYDAIKQTPTVTPADAVSSVSLDYFSMK